MILKLFLDILSFKVYNIDMGYIPYRKSLFDVEYYEKEDGTFPAEEFILSLDSKMQAKMFRELDLLETFGNQLREPHSKPLGDGIYEIRAKVASDITRVLYFFVVNKKIILTNGFVKKTQKTSDSEITLAKKYRKDYLERNKE